MKISFLFAWFDFWIGLFYDGQKNWLYVLPLPMVGVILKLPQRRYWLVSNRDNKSVIGSTTGGSDLAYAIKQDNVHGKAYWAVNGSTAPIFGVNHNQD